MNQTAGASVEVQNLAVLLDLTPRRIQQLTAEGVLIKVERGRYDLIRSVRSYVAYLREQAQRKESAKGSALERKRSAEAETAELMLASLKAQKLDAEDVGKLLDRIASTVRTHCLALASKLAPLLGAKMTVAKRKQIIEIAIHEALESLSQLTYDAK